MTRNRYSTGLSGMVVLTVTAACPRQSPTIRLDHFDRVSDFHRNYSKLSMNGPHRLLQPPAADHDRDGQLARPLGDRDDVDVVL